jgi:hypothetical protein
MNDLLLLLLLLVLASFLRAAWRSRRPKTMTMHDTTSLWPAASSTAEMELDTKRPSKRRRRRRGRAPAWDADDQHQGDRAEPRSSPDGAAATVGSTEARAGLAELTHVDLRRVIVWSEIVGPPRGLAPGPDPARRS